MTLILPVANVLKGDDRRLRPISAKPQGTILKGPFRFYRDDVLPLYIYFHYIRSGYILRGNGFQFSGVGMSHQVLSAVSLSLIKKKARILSRTVGNKSYMQYLDQVARDQFGVRHYHEAQALAKPKIVSEKVARADAGPVIPVAALGMGNYMNSYMNSYMNNCQQYYLDI